MATFSQYFTSIQKKPEPRQITWVCGPEIILVEEVVQRITTQLGPEPWNAATLSVGEDSERSVWAALDQHPLGNSVRLVVVRHADRLQDWDRFIQWIKDRSRNPRTYVVMVSDEESVPRTEVTQQQRRMGEKSQPLPHIAAIGTKGHVVECKSFTTATAKKSVEWVQSKVRIREGVAKHLLTRSNWDLRLVRDLCVKLSVFPGEVTITVVNALMAEQPRDTLVDALMSLDRRTALLAASMTPPSDIGRILGLLDATLDRAGMIHDMQSDHREQSEMARALGPQAFLLGSLLNVSKHYNAKRRTEIRQVLATVDAAYQSGETESLLEVVISQW